MSKLLLINRGPISVQSKRHQPTARMRIYGDEVAVQRQLKNVSKLSCHKIWGMCCYQEGAGWTTAN